MDILRFTKEFFAMERELDLLSRRIDGLSWWEPARHDVFYAIYHAKSGLSAPSPGRVPLTRRVADLATRMFAVVGLKVRIALGRYDVLALRAPRHWIDGRWCDTILDDILACTPGRVLVVDTFPCYHHIRLPSRVDRRLTAAELCHLNEAVASRFGVTKDVESLVSLRFSQFRSALTQYRRLLGRIRPKCVLLVQNGIEKALFHAASERRIPVVEAQHGLIHTVHPQYSYPVECPAGSLSTLPSIFLALSDHWVERCHYPVARTIVVGNRHIGAVRSRQPTDDILVISADIYETAIEGLLRQVAPALPQRRFLYKLHPNQLQHSHQVEARLADLPNVEIVTTACTLQQLVGRCGDALCVQSTGVYEALQAGVRVHLYARHDYTTHSDVFDHPNLRVVDDHLAFLRSVQEARPPSASDATPVFFRDFDAAAATALMTELSA